MTDRSTARSSGTEPRPFRVVEGRRHHGGGEAPGAERRREHAVDGAHPTEPDVRAEGGRVPAGRDPSDDVTADRERRAALGHAVEPEPDEPAFEGERGHPFE